MAGKRIILVEGPDDEHVIKAIFGQRNLPKLDEVKSHGGKDALLEGFPVRLKESDVEALGVVIDADTDVSACWQALRDRLMRAGYVGVPNAPLSHGTVLAAPRETLLPRVGVWVMPDNTTAGILEDFLRFLMPADSELFIHANTSVISIPLDQKRFTDLQRPKALIHTWLAWQEEPGRPLGQSITARFLDHNVPQVDVFVQWLRELFVF